MTTFKVAHVNEQGVDLIIVPLNSSFNYKTKTEQMEIIDSLQLCATSAGLRGTIVPVWDGGAGRMKFIAPQAWHSFFRSLSLASVARNINKTLTCR